MRVVASAGREDIAMVYIVEFDHDRLVECVEAVQPPTPRDKKWVLLVSTMFGCPVGCKMCDAGGHYQGKATENEILAQIDWLVEKRYPGGNIPSEQFKIQFARMGEPALNPHVLTVLELLPDRYCAPGMMPSISTIAPASARNFFDKLVEIKRAKYSGGHFQFQFSLHTTDEGLRDELIPVKKWSFQQMAEYGERFYNDGDRKITLNFALARDMPLDPQVLLQYFTPDKFLIKITPLNPTYRAAENRLLSYFDPLQGNESDALVAALRLAGFEVLVSIGEVEESYIGSNCGQYVKRHLAAMEPMKEGYTYQVQVHSLYD